MVATNHGILPESPTGPPAPGARTYTREYPNHDAYRADRDRLAADGWVVASSELNYPGPHWIACILFNVFALEYRGQPTTVAVYERQRATLTRRDRQPATRMVPA